MPPAVPIGPTTTTSERSYRRLLPEICTTFVLVSRAGACATNQGRSRSSGFSASSILWRRGITVIAPKRTRATVAGPSQKAAMNLSNCDNAASCMPTMPGWGRIMRGTKVSSTLIGRESATVARSMMVVHDQEGSREDLNIYGFVYWNVLFHCYGWPEICQMELMWCCSIMCAMRF